MQEMLRAEPWKRLCQGDILRNVDSPEYSEVIGDAAILTVVRFPLALVLSQDCDIQQDHHALVGAESGGCRLLSVLLAPLYEMNDAISGEQLANLKIPMPSLPNSKKSQSAKGLRQNQHPRYHCLPLSEAKSGLPDAVVDFKHYFTVSSAYLLAIHDRSLVASLATLYREDVCQRFAAYLARIGLPSPIGVPSPMPSAGN
jgi:hypothetical protein